MRRIIERVVTVVTTITWKVSWEEDPLHPTSPIVSAQGEADPVFEELPGRETFPKTTQPDIIVLETKEVDPPEIKI